LATHLKSYLDTLTNWSIAGAAKARPNTAKKVNLALQGGGAHGAFTWGVLDHLLADGRLQITGISGASAGAINAVMVADGLARGGPEEARKRLAEFWRAASAGGDLPPMQRAVADRLFTLMPFATTPIQNWFEAMSHYFSPYELNPLNINPLKDLIERFVDFDALRDSELALFVSATNVHTGRLRIFGREKITADVVMASAALPFLFQAVGANHDAENLVRNHQPAERDHLQLGLDFRTARDGFRQPVDRRWPIAPRQRRESIPPAQYPPHRSRPARQSFDQPQQDENRFRFLRTAASRRRARGAKISRPAFRRHRPAKLDRPRRRVRGGMGLRVSRRLACAAFRAQSRRRRGSLRWSDGDLA
jgi:predicted acylesterase/phospholipase RssA